MKYFILFFLSSTISFVMAEPIQRDTTQKSDYEELAHQIGIKKPNLRNEEYQVRLWVKVSLAYGKAQSLYILNKKRKKLLLSQYTIKHNRHLYSGRRLVKNNARIDFNIWRNLLENDVLTLPDQSTLRDQIFPKPVPRDTSKKVSVDSDGSITITAKKSNNRYVIIGDGTSYCFEVYGGKMHHQYSYHCPAGYGEVRTNVIELQKVVAILKLIFGASQAEENICKVNATDQIACWLC